MRMDTLVALFVNVAFYFGWGLLLWDFVVECSWLERLIFAMIGALVVIAVIVIAYGRK